MLYETFWNLISTVIRLDYRILFRKVYNKFESVHKYLVQIYFAETTSVFKLSIIYCIHKSKYSVGRYLIFYEYVSAVYIL